MILLYDAFWIFLLFNIVGFAFHSKLNLDSAFRFLITYVATLTFWYIPTLLSSAIAVPWAITFIPVMFLFFFVFALFFRWVYSRLFASS
jgi:ABC-type multidrug transport system permease subunit